MCLDQLDNYYIRDGMLSRHYQNVTRLLRNVKACYISRLLTVMIGIIFIKLILNFLENAIISFDKEEIEI